MKNFLRASFVVAGTLLLAASSARAVEIQRPEEGLELELHAKHGFVVYALLHPRQHVAVIEAQRGVKRSERKGGRWLGDGYAAHMPAESLGGAVDLRIGHVARMRGRFVASKPPRFGQRNPSCRGRRSVVESGYFAGAISFHGDGGYLRLSRRRALAYRSRSFMLRCKDGHADHPAHNFLPGLFGYIEPPMDFSNSDGTFLFSHWTAHHRATELMVLHHLYEQSTTFKAAVLEWLPGGVAATLWVEVSRVAEKAFEIDETERHPETASLFPPAPFAGQAEYSRRRGSLRGDLTVHFLGRRLPLTSPIAEAEVCLHTPKMRRIRCDS